MTVGELKTILDQHHNWMTIILSKDPEGNSYHHINELNTVKMNLDEMQPDTDIYYDECVIIWPS